MSRLETGRLTSRGRGQHRGLCGEGSSGLFDAASRSRPARRGFAAVPGVEALEEVADAEGRDGGGQGCKEDGEGDDSGVPESPWLTVRQSGGLH
eukprot:2429263-Rhodomonas_salina.2